MTTRRDETTDNANNQKKKQRGVPSLEKVVAIDFPLLRQGLVEEVHKVRIYRLKNLFSPVRGGIVLLDRLILPHNLMAAMFVGDTMAAVAVVVAVAGGR